MQILQLSISLPATESSRLRLKYIKPRNKVKEYTITKLLKLKIELPKAPGEDQATLLNVRNNTWIIAQYCKFCPIQTVVLELVETACEATKPLQQISAIFEKAWP